MKKSAQRLVDWISQDALPLWTTAGLYPESGASYETLRADGSPNLQANLRVRVQARQAFVFARAHQQGWLPDAEPLVRKLHNFVCAHAVTECRSDGYVHLLHPGFTILDAKRDLYDHAFFTLGYAATFAAFGDKAARRKARKIVDWLDEEWGHPAGGWREGDHEAPLRRQNPHMHLLETFLFLYDASQNQFWAAKAAEVFALFEQHFYAPEHQVLLEFFNEDWSLAAGPTGQIVEPGHMLEWVWLLRWYEDALGVDTSGYANALYSKVLAIGQDPAGLIYDEVDALGYVFKATKRLWPMTELIKASFAQAKAGVAGAEARAAKAIDDLFTYYLEVPHAGLYLDKRGAQNEIVDDAAPASTLYHLIVAAIEAKRFYQL